MGNNSLSLCHVRSEVTSLSDFSLGFSLDYSSVLQFPNCHSFFNAIGFSIYCCNVAYINYETYRFLEEFLFLGKISGLYKKRKRLQVAPSYKGPALRETTKA